MKTIVLKAPEFTTVQQYAVEIFKKHYHVSRMVEIIGDGLSYFLIARPYSGLSYHQWIKTNALSDADVKKVSLTANHTCNSNTRDMDVFAFRTRELADKFMAEQSKIVDTDTAVLELGTTYAADAAQAADLSAYQKADVALEVGQAS